MQMLVPTSVLNPATRPAIRFAIRFLLSCIPGPGTRHPSQSLPTNMGKFQKMETTKNTSLPKYIWHQWYDRLSNHIPRSTKMSESNTKQNVMWCFEPKIDRNTAIGYRPKKTTFDFDGRYVKNKSEKHK